MISVCPLAYRSANAGVVKLLSAWNHGNPLSIEPPAAVSASCSCPREPAVTSVLPCRFPTAREACTPLLAVASLPGFDSRTNH